MAKRRQIPVVVTLSVAPGVTKAQAVRELRTRVNDLCCFGGMKRDRWGDPSEPIDEADVRVRKIGRA